MTTAQTDFEAAFEAGKMADPRMDVKGTPCVLVPEGCTLEQLPELLERPLRAKQNVTLHTADSFVQYVNRFSDKGSMVFVDVMAGRFKAVIDYHQQDGRDTNALEATNANTLPRHGQHIVNFTSLFTTEFRKIKENSGKPMKQAEFALFLEDIVPHINQPSAADMLEIVTTLEAKKSVDFKSGTRLHDGTVSITFNETLDAKAGQSGQFSIPQEIVFGVSIHRGGQAYGLPARFRYRITEGNLVMWYDIDQLDTAIETSMNDTVEAVKKDIQATVLEGVV